MFKKSISIIILITMFITLFSNMAFGEIGENNEHIKNGGFEAVGSDGRPTGWSLSSGIIGTEILLYKASAYSGETGLGLKPNRAGGVYASQSIPTLMSGAEYTFTAWLKIIDANVIAQVKIEFPGFSTAAVRKSYGIDSANNEWTQVSFTFRAPVGVTGAVVMVRNVSETGELCWDDVSIKGEGGSSTPTPTPTPNTTTGPTVAPTPTPIPTPDYEYVEMPEGSEELIADSGFEDVDENNALKYWAAFGGWGSVQDAYNISVVSAVYRSGSHALKIKGSTSNPFIKQNIENPVSGATYQISLWYKITSANAKPGFKLEWYTKDDFGTSFMLNSKVLANPPITTAKDEWAQYVYHFVVPEGCNYFAYYVRLYTSSSGEEKEVYFDDASCYMIKEAPVTAVKVSTDEVFYYTDIETGRATAKIDLKNFPSITEVEYKLKDGDAVLASKTETPDTVWRFDLSLMTEIKKEYIIEAVAKDSSGAVIGKSEEKILRYPRPEMLRADGTVIIDNEPFYPVFAYHVYKHDLQYAAQIGINTVQLMAGGTGDELIEAYLDEAAIYGIKCLIPLYDNMKPAGHPDNVVSSTRKINAFKDHPSVLGWMVMDEATAHWPGRWDLFYDSYKLIRDLDPKHPVYMLQNVPAQFANIGKYTDILAYDPYPPANGNLATRAAEYTVKALAGVEYEKPVWCLNQAFSSTIEVVPGSNYRLLPTIMEERNLWYQALFTGASAVGFYSFSDAIVTPRTPMYNTTLWDGLVEFAKGEIAESYNHFLKHEYSIFSEGRGEDVWWSSYVKDGEIYMIVLNRHESEKQVSIPLISNSGIVKINGFTAQRVYGGSETITGNKTLNLVLEPSAAYVYKIISNQIMHRDLKNL